MNISAAGVILQKDDGKILILLRKPDVPEGNRWGIPGGKTSFGEEAIETAIRKTRQEIGLLLNKSDLQFLDMFHYQVDGNEFNFFVFKAKITNDQVRKLVLNKEGHSKYAWIDSFEAVNRNDLMVGMYPILEKFNRDSGN